MSNEICLMNIIAYEYNCVAILPTFTPLANLNHLSVAYPDPDSPYLPNNMTFRAEYAFSELKKDNFLSNLPEDKFIQRLEKHVLKFWKFMLLGKEILELF